MKRGDIYYIAQRETTGSEISNARPGVIVSNNALNQTSGVVEVVYLTSRPKEEQPTHATILATGIPSTALCEQVDTVSKRKLGDYCGTCCSEEMAAIDMGLLASLGLQVAKVKEAEIITAENLDRYLLKDELERTQAERDRYAKMIDMLLEEKEARS